MKYIAIILTSLIFFSCSKNNIDLKKQIGEVKLVNNRPTMYINDKPVVPLIYAVPDQPTGRWSWNELPQHNIKQFYYKAGIKIFQVDLFLDHIWLPDGTIKLDTALMQVRGITDVCPDASIFPRLQVNAPKWRQKAHSEEAIRYGNAEIIGDYNVLYQPIMSNDYSNEARISLASLKYRKDASDAVQRFCRQFSESPKGTFLVGIQVACGVYREWHSFGFIENDPDLCQPMTTYFRNWLNKKYKTNDALKAAWQMREVTLNNAVVPGSKDCIKTYGGGKVIMLKMERLLM
jgi:hypothetical protein